MIPASAEFHRAVLEGQPQRAILRFVNGSIMTNADISITAGGIHYEEVLNGETELTVGACPSSSLKAHLMLPPYYVTEFPWGKFSASLGVRLSRTEYESDALAYLVDPVTSFVITGHAETPYLRVNGVGTAIQPSEPVHALILEGTDLRCVFGNGFVETGDWDGRNFSNSATEMFLSYTYRTLKRIATAHRNLVVSDNVVTEYTSGVKTVWEYSPLGTFVASKPEKLTGEIIEMESVDQMSLFDVMMPNIPDSEFPMTIGDLLTKLCSLMRVDCVTTDFINKNTVIPTKPGNFADATAREVLGWIAQAACSYARFNRDGDLELVWFTETDVVLDESTYSELSLHSREVGQITRLCIRNSESTTDAISGTGANTYLIQDNPLLRQDESTVMMLDDEVSTPSAPIYERLSAYPSFHPASVNTFYDWTLQTGDVVQLSDKGQRYRVPIYNLSMDWKGSSKITVENSGSETRPPLSKQERVNFGGGRGVSQAKKELEAIRTWATIQIDDQAGLISLLTGRVDDVENDFSAASIRLDGVEAEIDMRVEKNGIIAAINMSAEAGILIQAEKIDLKGYVTMSDFNAFSAEIDNIVSGISIVSLLCADAISVDALEAGSATISKLTIPASGESVVGGTLGFMAGSVVTIPSAATLNLYGYKTVWKKATVATGTPTLSQKKRYLNFMLADGTTTGYMDIVTDVSVEQSTMTQNYLGRDS